MCLWDACALRCLARCRPLAPAASAPRRALRRQRSAHSSHDAHLPDFLMGCKTPCWGLAMRSPPFAAKAGGRTLAAAMQPHALQLPRPG